MAQQSRHHDSGTASSDKNNWWLKFLAWRETHIPEKTFVALLALIVGIAAGLAAVLLKTLIALMSITSRVNPSRMVSPECYIHWP